MTKLYSKKGFALIEFIIVIAIFAGLFLVISNFSQNATLLSNLISQNLQVEQELEQTFQTVVTEIRSMGPSSLGAYPIESASTSSLVFYSDIDEDGLFDRVRYFVGTSTLEKGVTKPSGNPLVYATSTEIVKTVVHNVLSSTSTFDYFNTAFTGTESPLALPVDVTAIRVVRITVTADVNPKAAPKPTTFSNIITIRNFRNN